MKVARRGRPMTSLETRTKVWSFWHEHSTISTKTSQPAKLNVGNRFKVQTDLAFDESVQIAKTRLNIEIYEDPWKTLEKIFRELYLFYTNKFPENKVSMGTFIVLKPFYVRGASSADIEMCCCKEHLHARSSIKALIKLAKEEGIDVPFNDYLGFFDHIYMGVVN